MASLSFLGRVFVAGVSGAVLVACTSALGNFTIDNTLDGGVSAGKEGGSSQADGGATADAGGGGTDSGVIEGGGKGGCNGGDGRYIFLTSDTFTGNFGGATPVMTANNLCRDAAKNSALLPPGTYEAWLSTVNYTPSGQVLSAPLFLPDCTMVVSDPAQYVKTQMLNHPVSEDQNGKSILDGQSWTATKGDGTYTGVGTDCTAWTDVTAAVKGVVGNSGAIDDKWTEATQIPCNGKAHLICIQTK
jgi:hypothetical protein